ncbi:hypothetical protein GF342_01060 [Candidatus Woesearchaeota archaeon]|nr:hypothetical protein [Candidatus Woesearchaeota archaeon]
MKKGTLALEKPVPFVEFFSRFVMFIGEPKDILGDTLFYLGPSKATKVRYYETPLGLWKDMNNMSVTAFVKKYGHKALRIAKSGEWKNAFEKKFGFTKEQPTVLKGYEDKLNITTQTKIISLIGEEYFDTKEKEWYRRKDRLSYSTEDLPFGFTIKNIKKDGSFTALFPERTTPVDVGKTYVYLAHQKQFQVIGMSKPMPHIYLTLFVKSHGMHDTIKIVDKKAFETIDSSQLCNNKAQVRDFRKGQYTLKI